MRCDVRPLRGNMTFRHMTTPEQRRKRLKQFLQSKGFVRVLEAHNGLSALVATNAKVEVPGEAEPRTFDAIWESSLTDSASKGQPDIEVVSFDSRLQTIQQITNVTDKPIIVDGDTGGDANHFEYFVAKLESLGVSAVIIEDKVFPKRNSLDADAKQDLENPDLFATKIARGKKVLLTQDFMIIARLESLIAGYGVEDALSRARKYLAAGVDGIMIHSKDKDPAQLFHFVEEYNKLFCDPSERKPLVAVPTTYNHVTENELKQRGINIVIHANHLLRTSYKSMQNVANTILAHQRSLEVDPVCASVKSVFDVVGFLDVKEKDKQYAPKYTGLRAIIPAAGQSTVFTDTPKPLLDVNGKTILERMRETFHKAGVKEVSVIRGFRKDLFTVPKIKYHDNDAYAQTHILDSLFRAQEDMEHGFIYAYADLLFNETIIKNLMDAGGDIVLVVDNTYTHHKHVIDKELDLVTAHTTSGAMRDINPAQHMHVAKIGKRLPMHDATHEFIGIAKFSKSGAQILRQVYDECRQNPAMLFHEAPSFSRASFTDIIQEIINRGHKVHVMEVNKGWIEIHQPKDIEIAKTMVI